MRYYIYGLEADISQQYKLDILKDRIDEKMLADIKTYGEYINEYSEEEAIKLLEKVNNTIKKAFFNGYVDLVDIKKMYDDIEDREFKLKIYRIISEAKNIVVLKHEEEQVENKKKWYEFWKKY